MAVFIDQDLCTGCKMCADICPVDAISGDKGKPQTIDQDICVMCGQCVQVCSSFASPYNDEIESIDKKLIARNMLPSTREPLFAAYYENNTKSVLDILENIN